MSELTKEHFDTIVKRMATKDDLKVTSEHFDKKIEYITEHMATKEDLEELARMTSRGFSDIQNRLDVTSRVSALENDLGKIKGALRLT
jgi:hypothetical protein